jgi:hypothetical protein
MAELLGAGIPSPDGYSRPCTAVEVTFQLVLARLGLLGDSRHPLIYLRFGQGYLLFHSWRSVTKRGVILPVESLKTPMNTAFCLPAGQLSW